MLSFKEFRRTYPEFMPSSSIKHLWLSTYKKEANIHSATMPGMYQSVNYSNLLAGVFLILILEIGATTIAYRYGVNLGAIVAPILIDFGLALLAHWKHGEMCELKNRLFLEDDTRKREQLIRKINNLKWLKWFFYGLIIASGIFKFYWFYSSYRMFLIPFGIAFDAYTLLVFCCYFFGSILHILCTGYILFTSHFHYRIHKEETVYINRAGERKGKLEGTDVTIESKPLQRPIETIVELVETSVGKHRLYKENEHYFLETTGLLLDEELRQIIHSQHNSDQRRTLAHEGVKIQLEILKL